MKAFFTSSLQSFVIIVILYFQSVICQNGWCKPPLSDVSAEVYAVEQATGSYTSYLNNIWYKERSTASFRCVNENHTLIGDSRRVCQYNGTWTGPIPRCVPVCILPPMKYSSILVNGSVMTADQSNTSFPEGTWITQQCRIQHPFTNDTKTRRICKPNGVWSGSAPRCDNRTVPPSTTSEPTESYFERGDRDKTNEENSQANTAIITAVSVVAGVILISAFIITYKRRSKASVNRKDDDFYSVYEVPATLNNRCMEQSNTSTDAGTVDRDGRLYENIIPVRVNLEPVYIQVEAGYRQNAPTSTKTVPNRATVEEDNQIIYARIQS